MRDETGGEGAMGVDMRKGQHRCDLCGGVGSARLRGFVFCPWGSAVWPQCCDCVLCVLWAMSAAVLGGGYPVGVSISSSW